MKQVIIVLILLSVYFLQGCSFFEREEIQTHTLTFRHDEEESGTVMTPEPNEVINLDVPERFGYVFEGYYIVSGGTITDIRFTNRSGQSLMPWENKESLVVAGKWTPIEFTLIFDIGNGRNSMHESQFSIILPYGSVLNSLAAYGMNINTISLPGFFFDGFYSHPHGLGERYADANDWLASKRVFNSTNFPRAFDEANNNVIVIHAYFVSP